MADPRHLLAANIDRALAADQMHTLEMDRHGYMYIHGFVYPDEPLDRFFATITFEWGMTWQWGNTPLDSPVGTHMNPVLGERESHHG